MPLTIDWASQKSQEITSGMMWNLQNKSLFWYQNLEPMMLNEIINLPCPPPSPTKLPLQLESYRKINYTCTGWEEKQKNGIISQLIYSLTNQFCISAMCRTWKAQKPTFLAAQLGVSFCYQSLSLGATSRNHVIFSFLSFTWRGHCTYRDLLD